MSARLFISLAAAAICFTEASSVALGQTNQPMTKELEQPPERHSCLLVTASGTRNVDGERSVYKFGVRPAFAHMGIVVFHDPPSKTIWAGEDMSVYVLTKHGWIGFGTIGGGFCRCKSLLPEDIGVTSFSELWTQFETRAVPETMAQRFVSIDIKSPLGDEFFEGKSRTSIAGRPKIDKVTLGGGVIKFDMSRYDGFYRAEVTLDEETLAAKSIRMLK